jgi:hypothetical protein
VDYLGGGGIEFFGAPDRGGAVHRLGRVHLLGADGRSVPVGARSESFLPLLNGGELAALYCFVFLCIAAHGAGIWSIDAAWARSSAARH